MVLNASASITLKDRFLGSLFGLAVGDALGATLEFCRTGSFEPISEMIGGGPFGLEPGQWTDDASMALCLGESLIRCGGHSPSDQMETYLRWMREGHLSSVGYCFDVGRTVRAALDRYVRTSQAYAGSSDERSAGNGSLMRLCPTVLYHWGEPTDSVIFLAGESSRTTHQAVSCIDACRYFAGLLLGALAGEEKGCLTGAFYTPKAWDWRHAPLCDEVAKVAAGSFHNGQSARIRGTGYVIDCLEAALWAFHGSNSFEEGALMAVNLGDDADTTGAVFGQLAGAYYGLSGIPEHWVKMIAKADTIRELGLGLYYAATGETE